MKRRGFLSVSVSVLVLSAGRFTWLLPIQPIVKGRATHEGTNECMGATIRHAVLAAAVVCLSAVGPTYAASLGPTGNSAMAVGADFFTPGSLLIAGSSVPIFDSSQPVTASALVSSATYATAHASFGVNRAKVYMGGVGGNEDKSLIQAQATSTWTDQFVITGGAGTGTVRFGTNVSGSISKYGFPGFIFLNFNIDAAGIDSPPDAHVVSRLLEPGGGGLANNCSNPCVDGLVAKSFDRVFYTDFNFTYDTPFLIQGQIQLSQTQQAWAGVDDFPAAFQDFDSTVTLTEVILPTGATLQSDSGTTYPIVFGVPFAAFAVKVKTTLGPLANDDTFKVKATLTLGTSSNGIAPLTEAVTVRVGTFSTTIPAGSFKLVKGKFKFKGVINGVNLEAVLQPLILGNDYEFKVEGNGADLTGTENPVTVGLTIGNDSDSKTVTAKFE